MRWADPRAQLLSGDGMGGREAAGADRAAAGRHAASVHLAALGRTLDAAWRPLADRLAEAGQADGTPQVRLEPDADGRIRIRVSPLEAVPEPPSLVALRGI